MFEVELKAHVCNREELIKKLNSFADYIRTVEKSDVYYHLPVSTGSSGKKSYISTRSENIFYLKRCGFKGRSYRLY